MKIYIKKSVLKWAPAGLLMMGIIIAPATSFAATNASATNGSASGNSLPGLITQAQSPSNTSEQDQCGTLCQAIKSAGAQAISARLASLNKVAPEIDTYKSVSSSNQAYLTTEVGGEISGTNILD
jgi:hypothetical protein